MRNASIAETAGGNEVHDHVLGLVGRYICRFRFVLNTIYSKRYMHAMLDDLLATVSIFWQLLRPPPTPRRHVIGAYGL